jgi:photosystem II stability/assembly factor-like uncharacterized protein
MSEQSLSATLESWFRFASRVVAIALVVSVSLILWHVQPAISATSNSTAASSRPALSLESIDFESLSNGLGVFTRESASGSTCTDFVGKSTDGGAKFNSLRQAMSWNCANADFSSSLTSDNHGDMFLYGPRLYVSHDDARTWTKSSQPGSVLDVAAVGLSVWMVENACTPAETASQSFCPVQLLQSANGGRTWRSSPTTPRGAGNGVSSGAHGQSYLIRVNRSSAYLMLGPSSPLGGLSTVPLWFTSNGGQSWSNRHVPCHIGALSAVLSAAPDGGLMVVCSSQPSGGSQLKSVLESTNGGHTWTLRRNAHIDSGYLGGIDLVSNKEAFLFGGRSSLLVTHDGGTRWRAVRPLIGDPGGGTSQVIFFNASRGLVLGNNDNDNELLTLWQTNDGGKHWTAKLPRTSFAP